MFTSNPRPKRLAAGLAVAAGLSVSLAACGNGTSDTASASSSSSKVAKPVASIDALTGKSTAIRLDKGFTDALAALKLTPGVLGGAKLTAGSLVFPITGGNVTYFKPAPPPPTWSARSSARAPVAR